MFQTTNYLLRNYGSLHRFFPQKKKLSQLKGHRPPVPSGFARDALRPPVDSLEDFPGQDFTKKKQTIFHGETCLSHGLIHSWFVKQARFLMCHFL